MHTYVYVSACVSVCACIRSSVCLPAAGLLASAVCVRMSVIFREDTHTHTHVYAHMLVQGIIWVLDDHRMHIWSVVV